MGLIPGAARIAVIAGTATAVSGQVQRRQAERLAERDEASAAERQAGYQQRVAPQAPPPPLPVDAASPPAPAPAAPPPAAAGPSVIEQLKDLAALRDSGVLTPGLGLAARHDRPGDTASHPETCRRYAVPAPEAAARHTR